MERKPNCSENPKSSSAEANDSSLERVVSVPRELAQNILDELYELRSERNWWKDEPRCNYQRDYKRLCDEISQVETIIAHANQIAQRPEADHEH